MIEKLKIWYPVGHGLNILDGYDWPNAILLLELESASNWSLYEVGYRLL